MTTKVGCVGHDCDECQRRDLIQQKSEERNRYLAERVQTLEGTIAKLEQELAEIKAGMDWGGT